MRRWFVPTVRTNVARMSVSSNPDVERTPGRGGTTTVGISSSSARRQAWSGPAPPKATRAKRRGSWPRPTETVRMARAMALSMISTMPAAASSTPRRRGRPTRASMAARAAFTSRAARRPGARRECGRARDGRRLPWARFPAAIAHRSRLRARAARAHGEPPAPVTAAMLPPPAPMV